MQQMVTLKPFLCLAKMVDVVFEVVFQRIPK